MPTSSDANNTNIGQYRSNSYYRAPLIDNFTRALKKKKRHEHTFRTQKLNIERIGYQTHRCRLENVPLGIDNKPPVSNTAYALDVGRLIRNGALITKANSENHQLLQRIANIYRTPTTIDHTCDRQLMLYHRYKGNYLENRKRAFLKIAARNHHMQNRLDNTQPTVPIEVHRKQWKVNKDKIKRNARYSFDYDSQDRLLYPKYKKNNTSYLQTLIDPLHKRSDLKRCKRNHQPVDHNGCPFPLVCRRLLTSAAVDTRNRDPCSQIAVFGMRPYALTSRVAPNPKVKLLKPPKKPEFMKVPRVNFHHDNRPMDNIDDIVIVDGIIKKQLVIQDERLLYPERGANDKRHLDKQSRDFRAKKHRMPSEDLGNIRSQDGLFNQGCKVLPNIGQTLADCDAYANAVTNYLRLKDAGDLNAVRPQGFLNPRELGESSDSSDFNSSDISDDDDDYDDDDSYDVSHEERLNNIAHTNIAQEPNRKLSVARKTTGGNTKNIDDQLVHDKPVSKTSKAKVDNAVRYPEAINNSKNNLPEKLKNRIKSKTGSNTKSKPDILAKSKSKTFIIESDQESKMLSQVNKRDSPPTIGIELHSSHQGDLESPKNSLRDTKRNSPPEHTNEYNPLSKKQESIHEFDSKSQIRRQSEFEETRSQLENSKTSQFENIRDPLQTGKNDVTLVKHTPRKKVNNIVIHRKSLAPDSEIVYSPIKSMKERVSNKGSLIVANSLREARNSLREDRQRALDEIGEYLQSLKSTPYIVHDRIKDNLDNPEDVECYTDSISQRQENKSLISEVITHTTDTLLPFTNRPANVRRNIDDLPIDIRPIADSTYSASLSISPSFAISTSVFDNQNSDSRSRSTIVTLKNNESPSIDINKRISDTNTIHLSVSENTINADTNNLKENSIANAPESNAEDLIEPTKNEENEVINNADEKISDNVKELDIDTTKNDSEASRNTYTKLLGLNKSNITNTPEKNAPNEDEKTINSSRKNSNTSTDVKFEKD